MLTYRIYEWARSQPQKPAVIANDVGLSYAQFARVIEVSRRYLQSLGLVANGTVIVLPNDHLDAWVFMLALRALGLGTVCVPSIDVAESLKLTNIACLVTSGRDPRTLKLSGSLQGVRMIAVPGAIFASPLVGGLPNAAAGAPLFGGHILLTSGTTGTYKKVYLPGEAEDARNAARAAAYPLIHGMTFHAVNLGLWTTIGFRVPSAVWHVGGCVIMDSRPSIWSSFFRHPFDLSIVTPPMLKELNKAYGGGPPRDQCEILVTAGFVPTELAEETVRRLTPRIGIAYGSTELAAPALLSRRADGDIYWLKPVPGRTIRIVDEHGSECPVGQEGELQFGLLDIDCKSYLDDDETSARIFRDGYFCPGDMAVRRADGRVRVLGRTVDVLNVRGEKFAVAPLEMAVQRALDGKEVCLFSGLDDSGDDELVIVVETDEKLPDSVRDRVAREFAAFAKIRFAFVKEFPRTSMGTSKTRRSILRQLVFPQPPRA